MKNINICVLGAGSWGINHIKTLQSMDINVSCVDINPKQIEKIKSNFKKVECFLSIEESFKKEFSGYIIATPASTHAKLAKIVISKNKPVLVEKPLSLSLSESKKIKSYLDMYDGQLIVGHSLLFHPAIQKIKTMIENGKIGKIQYIYSNRLNLGTVRKQENVFWSFAPHDISIFQYFSKSFPLNVLSMGSDILQKNIHDTTITYLKYPNDIQGHIYVSWLHPFKEHRLVVVGSKGSIHFDDSTEDKRLLFYEKDIVKNHLVLKNKISKKINYDKTLPLENELKYFIEVIKGAKIKKANIDQGIEVIRILEMATKSLERKAEVSFDE